MSSSFSCSVSVNPSNLLPEAPKQVEHAKHLPSHLEVSKTQAGEEKLKKSQAAAHDALQKEKDGMKEERKGREKGEGPLASNSERGEETGGASTRWLVEGRSWPLELQCGRTNTNSE